MTRVLMDHGLLPQLPDLLEEYFSYKRLGVICDEGTYQAAAERIFHDLPMDRTVIIHMGRIVNPHIDTANKLRRQVASCDALLAVGSGTINDLTKYTAHQLDIPYACLATAPSMNGYTSPTASLSFGKQKSSVQASPPALLVADLDVLGEAPLQMLRAGLGDVFCRNTIEADLILAHHLVDADYDPTWFTAVKEKEAAIYDMKTELHERDPAMIRTLMEALIIGGDMMRDHGSSVPCSQSEHMIVHMIDTVYGKADGAVLHGEAVSVATMTMSKLQAKLLHRKPKIRVNKADMNRFKRLFGNLSAETLHDSYQRKVLSQEQCDTLNETMAERWPVMKEQIEQSVLSTVQLENFFTLHRCPLDYKQLRWHKDRYEHAVTNAYLTRDRFTFLDVAAMDKTLRPEI